MLDLTSAMRATLMLEQEAIEADLHEPLETSSRLPASVVQYCARSRQAVVLSDASKDPRFIHDPRVIERGNHSVACLPLVHQGRLAAVLYLENRASTAAFHAGRVERLEFLGGHAAVALHNALLYEQLEDANATLERRVEERMAEPSGRNSDMRRVLDNTAQGLLTVDLQGLKTIVSRLRAGASTDEAVRAARTAGAPTPLPAARVPRRTRHRAESSARPGGAHDPCRRSRPCG